MSLDSTLTKLEAIHHGKFPGSYAIPAAGNEVVDGQHHEQCGDDLHHLWKMQDATLDGPVRTPQMEGLMPFPPDMHFQFELQAAIKA